VLSQHSRLASLHIDTNQSAGKPTYLPMNPPRPTEEFLLSGNHRTPYTLIQIGASSPRLIRPARSASRPNLVIPSYRAIARPTVVVLFRGRHAKSGAFMVWHVRRSAYLRDYYWCESSGESEKSLLTSGITDVQVVGKIRVGRCARRSLQR